MYSETDDPSLVRWTANASNATASIIVEISRLTCNINLLTAHCRNIQLQSDVTRQLSPAKKELN